MSDRVTIVAEPRTVTGKKVKRLRREGLIPGVIYGRSEPVKIQMDVKPLRRALRIAGTGQLATVEVEGREYIVLPREIQQHVTRREGLIPGVIYGRSEPVKIQMDVKPLRRALRIAGTGQLATVEVEGKEYIVLPREIQQHVTRRDIIHVDFLEVDMTSTIRSEADLIGVGESAIAATGEGVVTLALYSVEIECLPDALISQIEVDLSAIETAEDSILISDLIVPEGVTILNDPEALVARFEYSRVEEEEEEEELEEMEAGDVEVVGREDEDEEEEEVE